MKKSLVLSVFLFTVLTSSALAECNPLIQMVNQDPEPAVPGDYVRILFKVSGIAGPECGDITLELLDNYPLRFDPGFNPVQTLKSGTFARGYSSEWIVPYTVRVDSGALDGDARIELLYSTKGTTSFKQSKEFDLRIQEVKADFKIFIRSYDYSSRRLVLEVLNIAKNDVRSAVLTIPSQDNIKIFGGNKNIIGDLDSNDYTSTDFVAIPSEGKILVELEYTDQIGERRSTLSEVSFDPEYFIHTKPNNSSQFRNLAVIILLIVGFFVWRHFKKKKRKLIK